MEKKKVWDEMNDRDSNSNSFSDWSYFTCPEDMAEDPHRFTYANPAASFLFKIRGSSLRHTTHKRCHGTVGHAETRNYTIAQDLS